MEDSTAAEVLFEDENFIFQVLREEDADELAPIICETFQNGNPLNRAVKELNAENFMPFCRYTSSHNAKAGLSFIAREKSSQRIVCFMLGNDLLAPEDETRLKEATPEKKHPLFKIFSLLSALDSAYKQQMQQQQNGEPLKPKQVYHALMGGTIAGFEGKGLGFLTRRLAKELASKRGFSELMVEASNPATKHIWIAKLGATVKVSIPYRNFVHEEGEDGGGKGWFDEGEGEEGRRPFKEMEGNATLVSVSLVPTNVTSS
ncbi:hypothetical protein QOT17_005922 [Balamuthia mandrillaris]